MEKMKKNPYAKEIAQKFEALVDVLFTLRSESGCPWDRAQSLKDLKQYLLEETYELLQALDQEQELAMREELGDLLFQVVFIAQVMQERGSFTLLEALDQLMQKMIGRHPHVFGEVKAGTPEQALASWESMKDQEKALSKGRDRSILDGVPLKLPALLQAYLISSKVARIGFDWETEADVWKKMEEEVREFQTAGSVEAKEEEFGDLLFTMVNIARKNGISPEDALRAANAKFKRRFMELEKQIYLENKALKDLTLEDLDQIWERIKTKDTK